MSCGLEWSGELAHLRELVQHAGASRVWAEAVRPRLAPHYRPATLLMYRKVFEQLMSLSLESPLEEAELLRLYRQWLHEHGYQPSTVRQRLIMADRLLFYVTGQRSRHLPSVISGLSPSKVTQPYTEAEVTTLLERATSEQRVIVLLVLETALTVREIAILQWADIQFSASPWSSRLTLRRSDDQGEVPQVSVRLSPLLDSILQDWLEYCRDRGLALHVLRRHSPRHITGVFRQLCEHAGVACLGLTALRVTAGARVFRDSGSLTTVASHLRLKSVASAEPYARAAALLGPQLP